MHLNSAITICFVLAGMTGCAGLGHPKPELKAELSKSGSSTPADVQSSKVDVIFQPDQGTPERVERALSEPLTVQQILEQTGGIKKYRRIEVELIRQLPSGGFHKIPCEYDRKTRKINPEFDYALMPGDKVIVKEDKSTLIDDMLQSTSGGVGKRFTTGGRKNGGEKYRIEG